MLYFLMFALIGGMFYALRLHRSGQLFAKILPANIAVQIFGIATVFVALLKMFFLFSSPSAVKYIQQERNSEGVALWYMGQYLAGNHAGEEVLIVLAPDKMADRNQKIRLDALIKGIDKKLKTRIVNVQYNKQKRKRRRSRSYTYSNLNETLMQNLKCNVVVSLIGMPKDYDKMKYWSEFNDLPAIYTYRGYSYDMDLDIEDKRIAGFMTQRPGKRYRAARDGDVDESEKFFEKHFIFVTYFNLKDMRKRYEILFIRPQSKK